jgi:hypothetical protein
VPLQGLIEEGHIPTNKYELIFLGMPPITPTKVSGLEETLEVSEMPDRTIQSSGQTEAVEWTMDLPMHHRLQQAAMEVWYAQCKDPVQPGYKKAGSMISRAAMAGRLPVTWSLIGTFPKGRKTPDLDMGEKGETTYVTWTMTSDEVTPI